MLRWAPRQPQLQHTYPWCERSLGPGPGTGGNGVATAEQSKGELAPGIA